MLAPAQPIRRAPPPWLHTVTDIHAVAGFAEPISSWTHLAGAGTFLYLGLRQLPRRRTGQRRAPARFAAFVVFGIATVVQLALSGVYHLLESPSAARPVLQLLDHAAIFVLIAASITAANGMLFSGPWRWGMITAAWVTCALGISLKMVFFAEAAEWLGLVSYFAMGMLGLATLIELWRRHGRVFVAPLLGGGLVYTVGALLEFLRVPVLVPGVFGPHELLHVSVLIALTMHWRFFQSVLDGFEPPAP